MKIYTEINYKWENDQLVETDSKSFDYEGEITLCMGGGGGGGGADVTDTATTIINEATSATSDAADTVVDTATDVVDQVQDAVEDPITYAEDTVENAGEVITSIAEDNNVDRPGGTIEVITDAMNPSNHEEAIVDTVADAVQPLIEETSGVFDILGESTDLSGLDEETLTDTDTTNETTLLTDLTDQGDSRYNIDEDETLLGTRKPNRKDEQKGRLMANQTKGKSASLLTG